MPSWSAGTSAKCATLAALAALAAPASASELDYPPDSVLMFVAAWCAPCHAELALLPEIEAAALPRTVRVVGMDTDTRTEAMLSGVAPRLVWRPTARQWPEVREDLAGRTAGLPFSLVTDGKGRPCAESRRGLNRSRAHALVAKCGSTGK